MNHHVYLRAYMAGIVLPTILLLVAATVFTFVRYVYHIPVPIERVIVFPMAVVPNAWGMWNIFFVALRSRMHLSIGVFGGLLPILIVPFAITLLRILGFSAPAFAVRVFPIAVLTGFLVYYLAWKYVVGFLNRLLGIA